MILMGMVELLAVEVEVVVVVSHTESIMKIIMIPTESGLDFLGVIGITMALSREVRILAVVFMIPALVIINVWIRLFQGYDL